MEYRVRYDPLADALYVRVRDGDIVDSIEIRENVVADFDQNGEVVGIEVINFSKSKIDIGEILMKGVEIVAKP
ncbi:MAG: DUF2283 domain-containing protein [Candidatus Brockarchaeota archaeon]|nr:DUF2283 domain-containing protein [Candidatus Brockarchaeota archaeon]